MNRFNAPGRQRRQEKTRTEKASVTEGNRNQRHRQPDNPIVDNQQLTTPDSLPPERRPRQERPLGSTPCGGRVQKETKWQTDSTSSCIYFRPTARSSRPPSCTRQIEAVVSRLHGQIEKTENWGRRKLAYEIGHFKEGVYVLEVINGSGELMKELDRRLKVLDQVIRHMVVRVDAEKKVVDRTRTKRQTESERRRVKRGLPPRASARRGTSRR